MKKIYIIISLILAMCLLSGCAGELPEIDVNHESTSENVSKETEDGSSDQTESSEKDESSNKESSKIEETTEESDSEDTDESETETQTEAYTPSFEEHGELGEKLGELLDASKEQRIEVAADHIYSHSLNNYRGGEKELYFEDGKICQIMLFNDKQHHIIEYIEDPYWFFDDPSSTTPGVIKALEYLKGRPCYILEDDYGYRLSLFYMNGYFYLMNLADNGQVVHVYSFAVNY